MAVLFRAGLVCVAIVAGVVAFSAPARAAYPPPPVGLQLSTSIAVRGQTVGVTGEGWAAGSTVTLTFESTPVPSGTAVPNAQGNFSTTIIVPLDATLGPHEVVATGPSLADPAVPLTLSASLTVVASATAPAAAAPASHAPLPFTGWDSRGPLLGGLALLILGTAVVLVTRSRRHRSHA
jgi:hypothetical protein